MNNAWLLPFVVRPLLLVAGLAAVLLGVWWILEGTGIEQIGFKANQMMWAYRGAGLVTGGLFLAYLSRRV
jgi:hypothetical protein